MTNIEYNSNIQLWSGNVFRFAVWNCGDIMRSEDAVQEAFARLWEQRERVTVEKGLGFLLTVARRYLIDCLRHDTVVARSREELAQESETVSREKEMGLGDEMYAALQSLPEVQRTIIQLRDVEGYSYKEIAKMLDLSDQQVQVYLFRARTNMKKYLLKIKEHRNR